MQIGKRVSRIEQAQLAAEQWKKDAQHEAQGVGADNSMELNPGAHYQISNTRNDPVDLYTYVRKNQDDPAFRVSVPFQHCVQLLIKQCPHHFRVLFPN